MSIIQIPYFLQDIDITEKVEKNECFFVCKINMFPLFIQVVFGLVMFLCYPYTMGLSFLILVYLLITSVIAFVKKVLN